MLNTYAQHNTKTLTLSKWKVHFTKVGLKVFLPLARFVTAWEVPQLASGTGSLALDSEKDCTSKPLQSLTEVARERVPILFEEYSTSESFHTSMTFQILNVAHAQALTGLGTASFKNGQRLRKHPVWLASCTDKTWVLAQTPAIQVLCMFRRSRGFWHSTRTPTTCLYGETTYGSDWKTVNQREVFAVWPSSATKTKLSQ